MKLTIGGRQSGKTLLINKTIDEYLKLHPETVLMRFSNGKYIVEKPVKQVVRKMIEVKE